MGFYEELSKHYDDVFPFKEMTYKFLEKRFSSNGRVLDIATGTGNYAVALAEGNYDVTAIDLDNEMIDALKVKSTQMDLSIQSTVMNMLDLKDLDSETFDGIFCIGNSLVHLQTIEDIKTACKEIYKKLKIGGSLVVQIVNYDRILERDVKDLPLINRPDKGVKFIRKYDYIDKMIHFKTRLIVENDQTYDNVITLYPLRSEAFVGLLEEIGFKDIELFGGFDEQAFSMDAFPLIVSAKK